MCNVKVCSAYILVCCCCVCVWCSVREWIQCMQVCCQSRTSYSTPPLPQHPHLGASTPHLTPILPQPLPMCNYALDTTATAYVQSTPHPHFLHLTPNCYTSMVATPTNSTILVAPPTSSSLVDTGYVSAESSPTLHTVWVSADCAHPLSLMEGMSLISFTSQLSW